MSRTPRTSSASTTPAGPIAGASFDPAAPAPGADAASRPRTNRLRRAAAAGLLALTVSGLAACKPNPIVPPPPPPPPPPAPLAVSVSGNQLVDGAGAPLVLHGVNRSGAEYACSQGWGIFDGPMDAASVDAIAAWHVNVVRVPLNEDCWLGINGVPAAYAGANYRQAILDYVQLLHDRGIYAILELHLNAPGNQLALGQQVMADADHTPDFWFSVAQTFAADPAVIFDLYNEPHDITWLCWRDGCRTSGGWLAAGMQQLVSAVRDAGAHQPIMLGGLQWSSNLTNWFTYRPTDPDNALVASFHLYNFGGCNTVTCWNSVIAPLSAQVPVVTGEIGQDDCAHDFIDPYMDWADARGISYLGWTWNTWNCATGPSLISAYDGTPTPFGQGIKDHYAALAGA